MESNFGLDLCARAQIFFVSGPVEMSNAMKAIVGGYVKLADRGGLDCLEHHHRLLLNELSGRPGAVPKLNAPMVKVIEEELAIIDAGLQKLAAG